MDFIPRCLALCLNAAGRKRPVGHVCHGSRSREWQPCVKGLCSSLGRCICIIRVHNFRPTYSVAKFVYPSDTSNSEQTTHRASPCTVLLGFPVCNSHLLPGLAKQQPGVILDCLHSPEQLISQVVLIVPPEEVANPFPPLPHCHCFSPGPPRLLSGLLPLGPTPSFTQTHPYFILHKCSFWGSSLIVPSCLN